MAKDHSASRDHAQAGGAVTSGHIRSGWQVESSLYEGFSASIFDPSRPRGRQTIAEVREYRDACVMGAAHQLLEALKETKELLRFALLSTTPEIAHEAMSFIRKADAAVAKAEGRS